MKTDSKATLDTLFEAGTHFGYSRARRHPSAAPFIFATKDRTDVFDLEETHKRIEAAKAFVGALGKSGKALLMVAGKPEAADMLRAAAVSLGSPFVAGRWIGGTLTNFKNIRKRIERLAKLTAERESGELEKYTKKERLLIDREIEELEGRFGGLVSMTELPGALFVIDTRAEAIAVKEANQMGIPVVGLASSDCDFSALNYPIPGNYASIRSIRLVLDEVTESYAAGKRMPAHAGTPASPDTKGAKA